MARRDPDGSGRYVVIPDDRISEEWGEGGRRFRCTIQVNGGQCPYVNARNSNTRRHLRVAHHVIPADAIEELAVPGGQHVPEVHVPDDPQLVNNEGADQHDEQVSDNGSEFDDMLNADDDNMEASGEEVLPDLQPEPEFVGDGNIDAGELHIDLAVPNEGQEEDDRWPEQLVQMFARRQHLSDVGVQMLSEIINVVRLVNRPLDAVNITNRSRDQVHSIIACRSCGAAAHMIRRACSTAGCSG